MLEIKQDNCPGGCKQWHINESVPEVYGQVVAFQADGDELNFILACMDLLGFDKRSGLIFIKP